MSSLIVVGAGFSRHAGLPLGQDLFALVTAEAKRRVLWDNIIERDIRRYLAYLEIAKGVMTQADEINYEDFLSFLDYEHYLGLKGSDTWSREGNRTQLAVRNLIAFVLHECQKRITPMGLQPYLDFVEHLAAGDVVFSFNYDTILETALAAKGRPYRLFPFRLKAVHAFGGETDIDDQEIVLIKVHGSIDWFDISSFESSENELRSQPIYVRPHHPVFADPSLLFPHKIIDGLYWPDSPLQKIYRIKDLDKYFSNTTFVIGAPLVIAPSPAKTLYLQPLREFWNGFARAGVFNTRVCVIGFSMPFQDDYALQPMYRMITNFQRVSDLPGGFTKSLLKMVDFRQTPEAIAEYQERYRFVDWSIAETCYDGFDSTAVEMIFSDS
jgi:hypothetical protein